MYQVEDSHWWYQGMASVTRAILNRRNQLNENLRILDAGCGTGAAMTTYLAEYGNVTGIDLYPQALDFCRKRNASRLARASVLNLPFASASFDLITSFDVLYERAVSSDITALQEFARILSPSGRVLLRLPAYDWLRGQHDKQVHTGKRYTIPLVKELFKVSGLILEHISYANTFLFPIAVIKRISEKIFPPKESQSDLTLKAGIFNKLLQNILAAEAPLVANTGLPYGLSVVAIGRK